MRKQAFRDIPIEEVEGFWDRRPCNLRHSQAAVGSRKYFDEVQTRKYFVEPHIPLFADFGRWRDKKVLEIGCGIGTDTTSFARAGAKVTAVELSGQSLELARRRIALYGLDDRVVFHKGNCEELTSFVPVTPYDLVYSFGVLHHTPRPGRAISQMRAYMSPKSELRIMLYSKVSYKLFWIMREEGTWDMSRIDEIVSRNSEAQTGCPVTYTYTFDDIRALLKGFEITEMRKAHVFTWDIEAYTRHRYKKDAAWARVNDKDLATLEKELGWHTLVRARLAVSGRKHVEGGRASRKQETQ